MSNPFKRKKEEIYLDEYDEFETNYDEPEIIESFSQDELEEYKNKHEKKYKRTKRIINIIFIIIMFILIAIATDVIAVSRYNVGPFFAIKTSTLKDGGTKIYYGAGYKVIKYHQVQGRRDKEIGFWNLAYNVEPVDVSDIDLAIEFENNYEKTSKKYYKEFIRLSSTVKKVDEKNKKIILEYFDEDSKYTLELHCKLADKKSNLSIYSEGDTVNLIGTVEKFKVKTDKTTNRLYLSDCFLELTTFVEMVEIEE